MEENVGVTVSNTPAIFSRENANNSFPRKTFFSLGSFVFVDLDDIGTSLLEHRDQSFTQAKVRLHINMEPVLRLMMTYQAPYENVNGKQIVGKIQLFAGIAEIMVLSEKKLRPLSIHLPHFFSVNTTKEMVDKFGLGELGDLIFMSEHTLSLVSIVRNIIKRK